MATRCIDCGRLLPAHIAATSDVCDVCYDLAIIFEAVVADGHPRSEEPLIDGDQIIAATGTGWISYPQTREMGGLR